MVIQFRYPYAIEYCSEAQTLNSAFPDRHYYAFGSKVMWWCSGQGVNYQ
jgi:hypothetical protein